jgi:hypothetical protein
LVRVSLAVWLPPAGRSFSLIEILEFAIIIDDWNVKFLFNVQQHLIAAVFQSAVKISKFPDSSIGTARIPALHFAGIRGIWAVFLANSDRGIPSNRKL